MISFLDNISSKWDIPLIYSNFFFSDLSTMKAALHLPLSVAFVFLP
jgi:hypothetical protein